MSKMKGVEEDERDKMPAPDPACKVCNGKGIIIWPIPGADPDWDHCECIKKLLPKFAPHPAPVDDDDIPF